MKKNSDAFHIGINLLIAILDIIIILLILKRWRSDDESTSWFILTMGPEKAILSGKGLSPLRLLKQFGDQFDYRLYELDQNGCKKYLFGRRLLAAVFLSHWLLPPLCGIFELIINSGYIISHYSAIVNIAIAFFCDFMFCIKKEIQISMTRTI